MTVDTPEYEAELVVLHRQLAAEGVAALTLAHPDGDRLPPWQPGAHVDCLLGEGLTRQFSLCGDPADRLRWRIAVLREPDGRGGSVHVHERLHEGTRVRVRGPRNHFPLPPAARHLFVAGGIGITPILPMVAAAEAAGADWRLLYGGRSRRSMAFLDELAPYGDRVRLVPQDEEGLPDLATFLAEPRLDTLVHCCGPGPLLAAVEERCRAWPPDSLRTERFRPRDDLPPAEGSEPFEVELKQSGHTLTVEPGTSVLEAVRSAGVEVLSSCEEGTCGTCETDVLDGTPLHRDSLLTEEERAACDTMMICVSRSRGPRLVLDL